MSLLRDEPDSLDALVAATGDSLRIDPAFVEKDFWVIEVLRAATSPVQVTACMETIRTNAELLG